MSDGQFPNIERARQHSTDVLQNLGKQLNEISSPDLQVIISGSYGRGEATSGSDVDYYILHSNSCSYEEVENAVETVKRVISATLKSPAPNGAFGNSVEVDSMVGNIGGDKDDNKNITRRILFMTESKALGESDLYNKCLGRLLERYIADSITEHQLALFLLNDFIRFYRTMCVDFENKTTESGKPWGIRNIKLVFSRKLIYFAGVLIVAETAQQTAKTKRDIVLSLASMTPIDRIKYLFRERANDALKFYDNFLGYLDNPNIRSEFERTPSDRSKHTELFRRVKNEGHHFSDALISLLNSKYSPSHPIHRSLIV